MKMNKTIVNQNKQVLGFHEQVQAHVHRKYLQQNMKINNKPGQMLFALNILL